jgi:hypothetical protein
VVNTTVFLLNNLAGGKSEMLIFEFYQNIISHVYRYNFFSTAYGFNTISFLGKQGFAIVFEYFVTYFEFQNYKYGVYSFININTISGKFSSICEV